jgi:predicted dehydrogenase
VTHEQRTRVVVVGTGPWWGREHARVYDVDREFHRTFDKHVDQLLPAFRNNQAPPIHARAGRRALAVALAIVESFETGTRIDLFPDADTSRS